MLRSGKSMALVLILFGVLTLESAVRADTLRLGADGGWKAVSGQEDNYTLEVSKIKQLVNEGKTKQVRHAVVKLKADYPGLGGEDFDAFMQAEILYSEGKFVKAVRSYDSFMAGYPESNLHDAALDRKFAIGTAYLGGRKKKVLGMFRIKGYAEGIKIMEKVSDQAGDAPIALRAMLAIVDNLEKRGKFEDAYHRWSEISLRWPTGEPAREALLGMARCKHAAYKGPDYDVSNLVSARSYYENYQLRYSEAAAEIDVASKLAQITEQLAYKRYQTGRYYERSGNTKGANLYYKMVVENWPASTAAKMAEAAMDRMSQGGKEDEKWYKKTLRKIEETLL